MFKKRKGVAILCVIAALLTILIIWIAWGNQALELNTYRVTSPDLPKAFDGFRIAQLSDLHNSEMGKNNEKLISMLKQAKPDIIVITGDMIDSRNTKVDVALHLAQELVKIAPCYYVPGNHEARVSEYSTLKAGLIDLGVTVLENEKVEITISGASIIIAGVVDPDFWMEYALDDAAIMTGKLDELICEDTYTILLSHRPELFERYVESNVDLVFSGHAHGGQFRIPFIGGLIAPNQGLFPKYDAGVYEEGNTTMVVSRGIGNSVLPFRINNRPEIVLVELSEEPASIYGTYVRENKNDIMPFSITLNEDGTYQYFECGISSHIGMGDYTFEDNIVTLVDANIPGVHGSLTRTFKFRFEDGKLVFLAEESDDFMYIKLPAGAAFKRTEFE